MFCNADTSVSLFYVNIECMVHSFMSVLIEKYHCVGASTVLCCIGIGANFYLHFLL
jgi:hypothetical protein